MSASALPDRMHDPLDDVVTLVVGSEEKRLEAPRIALRLLSPVFKAMLGPQFSEGSLAEVPLPEDDPEMMEAVVALSTHERTESLTSRYDLDRLMTTFDKYDISAGRALVKRALEYRLLKSPDQLKVRDLHTAYSTGYRNLFQRVSSAVVANLNMASVHTEVGGLDRNDALLLLLCQRRATQLRLPLQIKMMAIKRSRKMDNFREVLYDDKLSIRELATTLRKDNGDPFDGFTYHEFDDTILSDTKFEKGGLCLDCTKYILGDLDHRCQQHGQGSMKPEGTEDGRNNEIDEYDENLDVDVI